MPLCEFGNSKHDRGETNIRGKCFVERSARSQIALHIRHPSSSPIASSPSLLSYIVFCKATVHVDGRTTRVHATPQANSRCSPWPFIQTFYFPGYVYTNKPYPRVACRENRFSRADPIFPFMTHCPREQSAPRTWMACIPRIYDASDKLDHAYIGRSLRLNYLNYFFI